MTVGEVKELYKGEYVDLEVYKPLSRGHYYPNCFHGDNCVSLGDDSPHGNYTEDMEAGLYELMDEEEYNNTIMANVDKDEYIQKMTMSALLILLEKQNEIL